jgi:plasmid stabilization system protein ParE
MTYQVVIPPPVEHEIGTIFDEFHTTERALSFLHDLNVIFDRIAEHPRQFPVIHTSVHRALLKHHEYSVFFEIDTDRSRAVIHAVIHQRRDPALWPR